tara:strand:- start:1778 stop:2077 length:300 start_codon:yes stop_codon:yes gene_type:complete
MSIEAQKFPNTGESIQVGGMTVLGNTNANQSISANTIIEVCDTSGSGSYVLLSTSSIGSAVDSSTSGAFYIPPYGTTRPFKTGDNTNIRGENVINIREL